MEVIIRRNIFVNGHRIRKHPNGGSVTVPDELRPFIEKLPQAQIVDKPVVPQVKVDPDLKVFDHDRFDAEEYSKLQDEANKHEEDRLTRRNSQQAKQKAK